jgi:hypothetical protein
MKETRINWEISLQVMPWYLKTLIVIFQMFSLYILWIKMQLSPRIACPVSAYNNKLMLQAKESVMRMCIVEWTKKKEDY